jgi:anti-sigma regulatory factor (Ser/Thr protein kinase)
MQQTERFSIGRRRQDISAFADAFEAWCVARQVPAATMIAFQVAFDELLTNAVEHGLVDCPTPEIEVRVNLGSDGLQAELIDNGAPFDPLADRGALDLDSGIDEREIGGLGIHLVRNLMDDVRYERSATHNHIFIGKRF